MVECRLVFLTDARGTDLGRIFRHWELHPREWDIAGWVEVLCQDEVKHGGDLDDVVLAHPVECLNTRGNGYRHLRGSSIVHPYQVLLEVVQDIISVVVVQDRDVGSDVNADEEEDDED